MNQPLFLGVDIGTTSLSFQVIDAANARSLHAESFDHKAALTLPAYPDAYAADAERLMVLAEGRVAALLSAYPAIASIGLTGQMHGVVCLDEAGKIVSPLYTWQNEFGKRPLPSGQTLSQEIEALSGERLPTGYGAATLYALKALGLWPQECARVLTIMDLLAYRLTKTLPAIHPSNAASFGAYDLEKRAFRADSLEKLGLSPALFPSIASDYALAGHYQTAVRSIPVSVAIGDHQAAVFGSLSDNRATLVNVGTGSQISFLSEKKRTGGEVRPYFDGLYLHSGAALCGGRAYAALAEFVQKTLASFGVSATIGEIYDHLNAWADAADGPSLTVSTAFCGSRDDPEKTGSITGLTLPSFTPAALSHGVLVGLLRELYDMAEAMGGVKKDAPLVVAGNAMRQNPVLRRLCGEMFGAVPLLPAHTEEAAYGAALYGAVSAGLIAPDAHYALITYSNN